MLSRLVITFLPRSKRLLISWPQSTSAVILEPQKIKSDTVSTVSPSISHGVMGPDAMIFVYWMLSFKPTFSLSSFTFIKRLLSSSSLSAIRCQGPEWGTLPMAKVMRKEAWHTQRRDQASGNPLFPSIYPKTRVCFMLSFITIFLGEGINVQLQANKNSWAWQKCFSLWTPLKVI